MILAAEVFAGKAREPSLASANERRSATPPAGSSDSQNPLGVVAETGNGPRHQTAGGFGGDAEALADLAEALALTVEETETGLHGVTRAGVERAEQFVEQIAVDERHHVVFGRAVAVRHQVAERGVASVADGLGERDRGGQAVQFGVGVVERLAIARGLAERGAETGGTVTRDADEAGLLVERTPDRLANPERGVRR